MVPFNRTGATPRWAHMGGNQVRVCQYAVDHSIESKVKFFYPLYTPLVMSDRYVAGVLFGCIPIMLNTSTVSGQGLIPLANALPFEEVKPLGAPDLCYPASTSIL